MPDAVSFPSPARAGGREPSAHEHEAAGSHPVKILGIDLKFLCHQCGTKLIIDVRWQGRKLNCPQCGTPAVVPHFSGVLRPPEPPAKTASAPRPPPPILRLSTAEIEFLTTKACSEPPALS